MFLAPDALELLRDVQGSIGRSVVDNDQFPVEATSCRQQEFNGTDKDTSYFSRKVFSTSQQMIGRFLRSL